MLSRCRSHATVDAAVGLSSPRSYWLDAGLARAALLSHRPRPRPILARRLRRALRCSPTGRQPAEEHPARLARANAPVSRLLPGMPHLRIGTVAGCLWLAFEGVAFAQTSRPTEWSAVQALFSGTGVIITTQPARTLTGRVVNISEDTIRMVAGGVIGRFVGQEER